MVDVHQALGGGSDDFIYTEENKDTKVGFWKTRGKASKIFSNSTITGWRTTFDFYEGRASHGHKTGWVIHEYSILQSGQYEDSKPKEVSSLSRVFLDVERSTNQEVQQKLISAEIARENHLHLTPSARAGSNTGQSSTSKRQTCSEMAIPIGITSNQSMFQPDPFSLSSFVEQCRSLYGVPPRPHWVTTYYGGNDIKLILHRFGSNIIFSNGLKDPYSSGGVLANISQSIVAVPTVNGSHCLDILHANKTVDSDWLVMQRQVEVNIIKGGSASTIQIFTLSSCIRI